MLGQACFLANLGQNLANFDTKIDPFGPILVQKLNLQANFRSKTVNFGYQSVPTGRHFWLKVKGLKFGQKWPNLVGLEILEPQGLVKLAKIATRPGQIS